MSSVRVIILGSLPSKIRRDKLTPEKKFLYTLDAVSSLVVGFREFERKMRAEKADEIQKRRAWEKTNKDKPMPKRKKSGDSIEASVRYRYDYIYNLWAHLNKKPKYLSKSRLEWADKIYRERNRFILSLSAMYYDATLCDIFNIVPNNKIRIRNLDKNLSRIKIHKKLLQRFLSMGGLSELTRCKSWNTIQHKTIPEVWFDWFMIGYTANYLSSENKTASDKKTTSPEPEKNISGAVVSALNLIKNNINRDTADQEINNTFLFKKYDPNKDFQIIARDDTNSSKLCSRNSPILPILGAIYQENPPLWPQENTPYQNADKITLSDFVKFFFENFENICINCEKLISSMESNIGLKRNKNGDTVGYFYVSMPTII